MHNPNDGCLYFGTSLLHDMDEQQKATGGMHGQTQLVRWNTRSDRIELFSDLVDESMDERPAHIHELAVDDQGRVYLGENDNHKRSSYLWSVSFD